MRRESSTVVVLVGDPGRELIAGLARSPNLSVVPAVAGRESGGTSSGPAQPGWEPGAQSMREAARRRAPFVLVPADPLAGVATAWHAMWDVADGQAGAVGFEEQAAEALSAWQDKRFELPDYYLVLAPPEAGVTGPDLYLGPLRAARPHRVAVAGAAHGSQQASALLDTLRSLEHGPWWPPLGELLDGARRFYAGGLAETQPGPR
jgi:hypothetical protein